MDDTISRQAAIDKLNEGLDKIPVINNTTNQAIRRDERISCVHELRSLPSAKREYKYGEWCTECKEYDKEKHSCPRFNAVIKKTIEEMKEERKTGRWLISEGACEPDYMECSRCNWITEYYGGLEEEWGYCPNCGAYMRGEEHEGL